MQAYEPYKNHYAAWRRTNSSPALETPLENMKHAMAILREMNRMIDEGEDEDEQVQLDTSDNSASVEAPSIASGPSEQPDITMSTSLEDRFNNMANDLRSLKHSITEITAGVGYRVFALRNPGVAHNKNSSTPQSIRCFILPSSLRPNPHSTTRGDPPTKIRRCRHGARRHFILPASLRPNPHSRARVPPTEIRRCHGVRRKGGCMSA
ncbi:hypothetical protein B0H10DRAFT_534710 [Mycena sp. CBHHK59/15]|nr:hypothetical protein B0H10DRAFT_534710 [Mycena sp. CBHHK59/15]